MFKRSYVVVGVLVLSGLLLAVALAGCTADQLAQARQQKDTAQTVLNATTQAVADLQSELTALPPDDPARKRIEEGIAKGKQVITAAQQAIAVADGTIRSIEQGELDPGLRGQLQALPYGGYAIVALSLGFGIWRLVRQRRSDQTLERVVESWNQVVNPLTDEEKAKVRSIQGTEVTQQVDRIRAGLATAT